MNTFPQQQHSIRSLPYTWRKFAVQQLGELAHISGYCSSDHYLTWWAHNKGYESFHQFRRELFRVAKENVNKSERMQAWSARDWEGILHRVRPRGVQEEPVPQEPCNPTTMQQVITERLKELGKTQRWLSKELGISRQAVHQYIIGFTEPRKSILPRLKEVLDIDNNEIFRSTKYLEIP